MYAQNNQLLSQRGLVFVVILGLHALFFYALNSGLANVIVEKVMGPIETRIIEENQVVEDEPPPPPPQIEKIPPYVPPPDINVAAPVETVAPVMAITTTNVKPVEAPPPAPVAADVVVLPKSNPRRPLTQPDYPPASKRLGEAGTVLLNVYVLEDGKVGEATVQKSSGFPRLDEAAVREVKRSWRLTPGTKNGKPAAMYGQFAVTFKLTD
jgi:periplasmic protein TonB